MFLKHTVFILGAGASYHYGYPTGEDLVKNVNRKTVGFEERLQGYYNKHRNHQDFFDRIPSFIVNAGEHDRNSTIQKIEEYISQCQSLKKKLDQIDPPVIDHFLSKNQPLADLGKFLIAWEVLECERKEGTIDGNWYRFLIQHMMSNCNTPDEFFKNNVSFITFNYDVSLEKRLYWGLKENHFFDGTTVLEDFFTQDRIRHVYGKIRENPYTIAQTQYTQNDTMNFEKLFDDAYIASQSIQTMFPKEIDRVSATFIEKAENIYILGYGFDAMNNKNIGLKDSISSENIRRKYNNDEKKRAVYFTNFEQKNVISKRMSNVCLRTEETLNTPIHNKGPLGRFDGYHYEMSTKNVYKALSEDFDLL